MFSQRLHCISISTRYLGSAWDQRGLIRSGPEIQTYDDAEAQTVNLRYDRLEHIQRQIVGRYGSIQFWGPGLARLPRWALARLLT
jgi:hypothetical protein